MANIGIPGLILILVIALIIFGPAKLPELGKAVGSTLREFKNATTDLMSDDKPSKENKEEAKKENTEEVKEEDKEEIIKEDKVV